MDNNIQYAISSNSSLNHINFHELSIHPIDNIDDCIYLSLIDDEDFKIPISSVINKEDMAKVKSSFQPSQLILLNPASDTLIKKLSEDKKAFQEFRDICFIKNKAQNNILNNPGNFEDGKKLFTQLNENLKVSTQSNILYYEEDFSNNFYEFIKVLLKKKGKSIII